MARFLLFAALAALVVVCVVDAGEGDCPKNEVWGCHSTCPITCQNKDNPPLICTADCKYGCACAQEGQVRDLKSNSCVNKEDCPE